MNQLKNITLAAPLGLILVIFLAGCGAEKEPDDGHGHEHSETADVHAPHLTMSADESMDHHGSTGKIEKPADARKVTVIATDFAFEPSNITAKPGEKLFIELVNTGNAVHMWQLEGKPETHVHTSGGETSSKVVIAPEKAGSYKLVCSTPGHVQFGMVGTLTVK